MHNELLQLERNDVQTSVPEASPPPRQATMDSFAPKASPPPPPVVFDSDSEDEDDDDDDDDDASDDDDGDANSTDEIST